MNLSQLSIAPILPLWLILLLLAAGAAACVFQFRLLRRRLLGRRALLISFLRLSAFALLGLIALNPFWTERKEIKISPSLAVLLDTSPGMGLAGNSGKGTRLDDAKEALLSGSSPLLKSLSEKYEMRFFELGESLKAFQGGEISQIKTGAKRGDLNDALKAIAGKNQFALLFSDGNVKWENSKAGDLPLLAYPLGSRDEYRDVLVKSVKVPSVAFRGKEVVIDAVIKGYGYEGLRIPVILKSGEKLLTTKSIRLQSGTGEGAVTISFTPEEIGSYTLSLMVPPQVGEALATNNQRNFSLKVVRDKIRILTVSGAPSMNYRFLRAALKNDPAIDLLSFVILRMPSNILNVPVQEQSLIPFPVDTLFTKDLKNFDLLIFDNFLYHPFLRTQYLGNIRDFVREGGAFAFIGGANFLGEGGYGGTPLEEILPTRWIGRESYRRPASLTVRPSRAGANHPITRFSADEAAQKNLWQEMPPLGDSIPSNPKTTPRFCWKGRGRLLAYPHGRNLWRGRALVLLRMIPGSGTWGWWPKRRIITRIFGSWKEWSDGYQDPSLDSVQIALPEKGGRGKFEFRVKSARKSRAGRKETLASPCSTLRAQNRVAVQAGGQAEEHLGGCPRSDRNHKIRVEGGGGRRRNGSHSQPGGRVRRGAESRTAETDRFGYGKTCFQQRKCSVRLRIWRKGKRSVCGGKTRPFGRVHIFWRHPGIPDDGMVFAEKMGLI
jgi:hypothetical protein